MLLSGAINLWVSTISLPNVLLLHSVRYLVPSRELRAALLFPYGTAKDLSGER